MYKKKFEHRYILEDGCLFASLKTIHHLLSLKVSCETLRRWVENGVIKPRTKKFNPIKTYYCAEDIKNFLQEHGGDLKFKAKREENAKEKLKKIFNPCFSRPKKISEM